MAVSAALDGDDRGSSSLARVLGDGGAGALAAVPCDGMARRPAATGEIVRVARALCRPPGQAIEVVRTRSRRAWPPSSEPPDLL